MSRKLCAALAALILLSFCPLLPAQQPAVEPPAQGEARRSPPAQRPPEDPAKLEADSQAAYAEGEYLRYYIANLKLHKMFPQVPQYMVNLVKGSALLDKRTTAYHYMHMMQQQGLSYDFNATEDTANIRGTQAYDYMSNLMIDAGQPAGDGEVAATVPGLPQDFGAIAWDPTRERLLLGTIREGRLLALGADGSVQELLRAGDANGLWSIGGLAVDSGSDRLWIATSATEAFAGLSPADRNRATLVELELGSLEVVDRYHVPVDALRHQLGAVAATADGHVYVIDTLSPIVYRKAPSESKLEAFVASDRLVGFTDLAVTPDNSRLFVADPVMGVFLVDPRAQSATMLQAEPTLNLAGIDGIAYADGKLFIVQGGISPQRVMRLELDPAGSAVATVSPMAIALEPFDWPRLATLGADGLYYLANQGAGAAEDGLIVMRSPLDAGQSIQAPDVQDLQRALQSQLPPQPPQQ